MRRTRQWIEDTLRQRIRDGVYAPGSPLPTHRELMRELGASSATLQQAFHRLTELGYVDPRNRRGTLVASRLPNQGRLAMVFPHDPEPEAGSRFYFSAQRVAEAWDHGDFTFRTYTVRKNRLDSASHRRLCQDVADGGVAGVVFIHPPYYMAGSPVLQATVPLVVVDAIGQQEIDAFGCSVISPYGDELPERILRSFHAAGRRRMAGIMSMTAPSNAAWLPLLRRLGIETRPEWWPALPIEAGSAPCARDVARLLCAGSGRQRPDCLLVADDNHGQAAIAGLLDAGLRVPIDLDLAVHANFPNPVRLPVPCARFGNDMHALLSAAVAEVARLSAGGRPQVVRVPAALLPAG